MIVEEAGKEKEVEFSVMVMGGMPSAASVDASEAEEKEKEAEGETAESTNKRSIAQIVDGNDFWDDLEAWVGERLEGQSAKGVVASFREGWKKNRG